MQLSSYFSQFIQKTLLAAFANDQQKQLWTSAWKMDFLKVLSNIYIYYFSLLGDPRALVTQRSTSTCGNTAIWKIAQ